MSLFENNIQFDKICNETYNTSSASQKARFESLYNDFVSTFSPKSIDFFSSPGRIEIVGNHTDHNRGKVLCAAINFDTLAAVEKRDDGLIQIKSNGYPMLIVNVNEIGFLSSELGTSLALIKGVIDYFVRSNKKVGGFVATMTSTVPKGAGVSSSSSFECMIAEILNVYYNESSLSNIFKAKAAQYAEKIYFGKPCGLMDQSAIAIGGVNEIDFNDLENPIVKNINWTFKNIDVYVIATGGDHCDLTDEYAAIPYEMKLVAEKFNSSHLRDVDQKIFENKKEELKKQLSVRAILRAEHYFEENERVDLAANAIESKDIDTFLDMVTKSGESSRNKLQNTYSPKSKNKNIEIALDSVEKIDGVLAKRVHGGGFAGTILLFADKKYKNVESDLIKLFRAENVFKLSIRDSGTTKLELE